MRIAISSVRMRLFIVGAVTAAPMDKRCADYSGVSDGVGEMAGMVPVPGGAFAMGADRQILRRARPRSCASTASTSIGTR